MQRKGTNRQQGAAEQRREAVPPGTPAPGVLIQGDGRVPSSPQHVSRGALTQPQDASLDVPTAQHEPTLGLTKRRLIILVVVVIAVLGGFYYLLPKLAGLKQTWGQLEHGDPLWLALGAALELASIGGYAVLFRTVIGRDAPRIDWRTSAQITLAGIAAIRLVAAAGAGGVAVTAWALGRAGMPPRLIGCRMVASLVVQYAVYLGALVVCGLGLYAGVLAGGGTLALTLLPAILALVVVVAVTIIGLRSERQDVQSERSGRPVAQSLKQRHGRLAGLRARLHTVPTTLAAGVRTALELIRQRRIGLLGAVVYWAFDIAVLGVCFRAFGGVLPIAVLVMGYFLGTLGSLLPLPGGIGGVEGGMIGAFAAFGVPGGRAVIAVLAYRAISFWLPTLPGIAGYLRLRATVRGWQLADTRASD